MVIIFAEKLEQLEPSRLLWVVSGDGGNRVSGDGRLWRRR